MHDSVLDFIRRKLPSSLVTGRTVLEVGSLDVNGSPRSALLPLNPETYIGVDIVKGPGVDRICDVDELEAVFGQDAFDVVLSTEMLEHVEDWKRAVSQMKRVVKRGGVLCVTTRSPGFPYHPHPIDRWRFRKDDFVIIFRDFKMQALEEDLPGSPGIFGTFSKPKNFAEVSLNEVVVETVSVT